MPDFIKLPTERVEQLRALSHNLNKPIADLIADYVHDQIAKGRLSADIPSIGVKRVEGRVELDFGDFAKTMEVADAKAFALALGWFATPQPAGMKSAVRELAQTVSGADQVGISRRGTSIKIAGDHGEERTLAPSVARDLAQLIERAAVE